MPTLAQGEPRTIVVSPASGPSNTLSYTLPPGVTISLESVLAAIDATGATDTTATLTIADSSGAVIARKAQGQAVTGGVAGSATWALRLDDEAPAAAGGDVTLLWSYTVPAGGQATVDTSTSGPMAGLLSQAFTNMDVLAATRLDALAIGTAYLIRFNADAGNHYDVLSLELNGNPVGFANGRAINTNNVGVRTTGANAPAARPGLLTMRIPGYSSTVFHKTGDQTSHIPTALTAAPLIGDFNWFNWHPVAVAGINRIQFLATGGDKFVADSVFSVYGRK